MKILFESLSRPADAIRYCQICQLPMGENFVVMSVWYGQEEHPDQFQCHARCADAYRLEQVKNFLLDRDEIPF